MRNEGASRVVGVVAVTAHIMGIRVRSAILETNNESVCKDAGLLRDRIINVYTSSDAEEQSSVLVPFGDDGSAQQLELAGVITPACRGHERCLGFWTGHSFLHPWRTTQDLLLRKTRLHDWQSVVSSLQIVGWDDVCQFTTLQA